MAAGRWSLKRNLSQELFVDVDDVDVDSCSDEDFVSDSDYSEGTDERLSENDDCDLLYDENLPENPLCIYENTERAGTDVENNWSSDVKPVRQFTFLSDPKETVN